MTKEQEEAIKRLKRIDIKYFISGMMEQRNYIIDEADKTNKAIETVLSILEEKDKIIDLMAGYIEQINASGDLCKGCKEIDHNEYDDYCKECIKQYFENEVRQESDKGATGK